MQSNYDERHHGGIHWFGWLILALLLVAVVVFVGSILVHGYYAPTTPYAGYPFYGWFFFPFGFIFFFIIIFFIFRLAFWGFGGWGWRRRYWYGRGYGYGDAKEILRQRYARGEITKDQFDQMMRDLDQH